MRPTKFISFFAFNIIVGYGHRLIVQIIQESEDVVKKVDLIRLLFAKAFTYVYQGKIRERFAVGMIVYQKISNNLRAIYLFV
jgi:hypothetical protein